MAGNVGRGRRAPKKASGLVIIALRASSGARSRAPRRDRQTHERIQRRLCARKGMCLARSTHPVAHKALLPEIPPRGVRPLCGQENGACTVQGVRLRQAQIGGMLPTLRTLRGTLTHCQFKAGSCCQCEPFLHVDRPAYACAVHAHSPACGLIGIDRHPESGLPLAQYVSGGAQPHEMLCVSDRVPLARKGGLRECGCKRGAARMGCEWAQPRARRGGAQGAITPPRRGARRDVPPAASQLLAVQ